MRISLTLLTNVLLICTVWGAQPPAPEGRFEALCEAVPLYDLGARYTGYCDVKEEAEKVTVRYSRYEGADLPRGVLSGEKRDTQYSVEFVPGHFPFMRFEIVGWGQTIIYPVSLDRQAEFMRRAGSRRTESLRISYFPSGPAESTLTITWD